MTSGILSGSTKSIADADPRDPFPLLDLDQHCSIYIKQVNGNDLELNASILSRLSAITSLQNTEIVRPMLLLNRSTGYWICWWREHLVRYFIYSQPIGSRATSSAGRQKTLLAAQGGSG